MLSKTSHWRNFDIWLMAAVLMLTAYGILMIRSAVTGAPALANSPSLQIVFVGVGLVAMIVIAAIDYRYLTSAHWYIYALLVASLVFVVAAGQINNEARRWIQIAPGLQLQPSELGRILLAITFAQFLATRRQLIQRFSNTLVAVVYIAVPTILVFVQPDLGMSVLFLAVWFVMIWVAGLPLTHFLLLGLVGALGVILVFPNLADYQRDRVVAFLNPETADPESVFNVDQSLISIGSGGLWGKGYFQGTQSQLGFLRVQHTDFIFSMITEEMGLMFGALVVLLLMGFILWRILRAASNTQDLAGKLICAGIATVLFFQTFVSVGMNLRLLPVTGLTLPFVSYGGSSLVTLFLAVGIVQSVIMRQRQQDLG